MIIHCDVCGGKWEIYHRDNWNDDKARQCPHCFSKIDEQVWKREIIPAFAHVSDANLELVKAHADGKPLFMVDIIADHMYQNRHESSRICPLAADALDIETTDFMRY